MNELQDIMTNFFISSNKNGVGDNRRYKLNNCTTIIRCGRSKYRWIPEIFGTIVAGLGSKIQSGEFAAEATKRLKDASLEAEASYSGVNLDTEASKLIELRSLPSISKNIIYSQRPLRYTNSVSIGKVLCRLVQNFLTNKHLNA